ncbi:cytochrome P450 [Croceicoccus sp. F390]|uniref:Cytochrome P450 n=1 Tax=Croceicoccus esteveae TaxID=3075597 RepID=A0ABU2ZFK9_9SPHN|nr:cytochrome P450 [Croceicoccus sp. F390]MDT0575190.1 cytochrome P450 [Croceicoccus sp. F390]
MATAAIKDDDPRIDAKRDIPEVSGIPLVGNTLEMSRDPAAFFLRAYREYGPVYRVNVFGRRTIVIAGPEAGMFMTTREGRDSLRSKEFWGDFVNFHGASKTLTGEDGENHEKMRRIMRHGFSKAAVAGQYHRLVEITDEAIARDWLSRAQVPVVEAYQYLIVQQLGEIMTGSAPLEYVRDIRINILYLLNTLVTKTRPKFMLHRSEFRKANARVNELGREMIKDFRSRAAAGALPNNLLGDVMRAHESDPELIQARDLALLLTGPYVAGLDTVANTIAAATYGILKTPGVLERVQQEADTLYGRDVVTEHDVHNLPAINGAIMEAMRLWPIAVAQMRTATRDFIFAGHVIPEGETIYIGTSVPHFMHEFFPDPEQFNIDRYQRPRAEHLQKGAYSPFGRGPHSCLGQSLAEVQMATTISRIFHRLELALPSPDYVLKTKSAPTPGPSMDFKVKVLGERRPARKLTPEPREEK